jgi:hypothetical protein
MNCTINIAIMMQHPFLYKPSLQMKGEEIKRGKLDGGNEKVWGRNGGNV